MEADTFKAISHPFRKHVLETLADGELHDTASLVVEFDMTKAAISQHFKILKEARLVQEIKAGRHKHYCLNPQGIHDVLDWAETFQAFWTRKMVGLNTYLEERHERKKQP